MLRASLVTLFSRRTACFTNNTLNLRSSNSPFCPNIKCNLIQVQSRQYAVSPTPKLKTYGVLHNNVRQLLRIIHPDTFRSHMQEDNPKADEYKKLSMINQRSMQSLNSFNATMKNYGANMGTFLKGSGETIPIEFHIITNQKTMEIKKIRSAFVYPHVNKQIWVRHTKAEPYFYHWRDIQFLDLLNRVHTIAGSESEGSLLPNDTEIEALRAQSKFTRIPLPIHCK